MNNIIIAKNRAGKKVIIPLDKITLIDHDGINGVICMDNGKEVGIASSPVEVWEKFKERENN